MACVRLIQQGWNNHACSDAPMCTLLTYRLKEMYPNPSVSCLYLCSSRVGHVHVAMHVMHAYMHDPMLRMSIMRVGLGRLGYAWEDYIPLHAHTTHTYHWAKQNAARYYTNIVMCTGRLGQLRA